MVLAAKPPLEFACSAIDPSCHCLRTAFSHPIPACQPLRAGAVVCEVRRSNVVHMIDA